MKTGVITKIISNQYTVSSDNTNFLCMPRGILRHKNITPLVGDIVEFDINNLTIDKINPRKNELKRPNVANVDIALVVTSVAEPDLSLNLLDKLLSIITINNIKPVICFTKIDLLNKNQLDSFNKIKNYYENIGYQIFVNTETELIKKELKNKIVVLTGQSGAGKSTLLNKLEPSLDLKTNPISKALNRGVHTTRHVEIYKLDDIYFVDTPGFSAINFSDVTIDDLKHSFIEFNNIDCKYKDCNHDLENDCKIKEKVENNTILKSRYENYLLFKSEIESIKKY